MRAQLIFINKIFWKRPINIILGLVVPVIFSVFATVLFCIQSGVQVYDATTNFALCQPNAIVPELSLNGITCLIIGVLPITILSLRKSDIVNRLNFGSRKVAISYVVTGFYFFVLSVLIYILSFAFLIGVSILVSNYPVTIKAFGYMFKNANYPEILYSLVMYVLLAISVAFLIGLFFNTLISTMVVSITFILLCFFLNGGFIPLQLIAQNLQNSSAFDFWKLTSIMPLRWTTMPLLEAWMQGPIINKGSYDWNGILALGLLDKNLPYDLVSKLGYSSIFDWNHPFVTNMMIVPYFESQIGSSTFNSWYPKSSNEYQFTAALWSALWLNIPVPNDLKSMMPVDINNFPTYTFADGIDKAVDIIAPVTTIFAIWTVVILKYTTFHKEK